MPRRPNASSNWSAHSPSCAYGWASPLRPSSNVRFAAVLLDFAVLEIYVRQFGRKSHMMRKSLSARNNRMTRRDAIGRLAGAGLGLAAVVNVKEAKAQTQVPTWKTEMRQL